MNRPTRIVSGPHRLAVARRHAAPGALAIAMLSASLLSACGEAANNDQQGVDGMFPAGTPSDGMQNPPGQIPPTSGTDPQGMDSLDPTQPPGAPEPGMTVPTGTDQPPGATGSVPIGDPPPPDPPVGEPVAFEPAPGAFRRLTRTAFSNTLRDLLNGEVEIGELEPDSWATGGLPTVSAAVVAITDRGVELYQLAAEEAVTQLFADTLRRDAVLGCQPTGNADSACFQSFVTSFGRRAFRQPLTDAQVSRYTDLISEAATVLDDPYEGMKAGMIGLLTSPYFLYRVEAGEPAVTGNTAFWQYTNHETASRLSYFLTNSTPDQELLDAADRGELQTADQIRAQAERLLDSEAGRESVGNFATEMFQLPLIQSRDKDPSLFPDYTEGLRAGMAAEVPAMFQSIVFDRGASALELFTTRSTFVNDELAELYGLPSPNSPTDLAPAELPADGLRAGLLGAAGILSLFGNQKEGSPTHRGKFVREVLLCQTIPAPPGDVSTVLPDPPQGVVYTKREKLEMHMVDPACSVCHALTDPIGLTMENFDAIGSFRDTDNGKTIDVSGELSGTVFNGPVELGQIIAGMPEAGACLAKHVYRYGTGHVETPAERETVVKDLTGRFEASGFDLRNLMLEIVSTDGFRLVAPPAL